MEWLLRTAMDRNPVVSSNVLSMLVITLFSRWLREENFGEAVMRCLSDSP
jgi:hypothetical protein